MQFETYFFLIPFLPSLIIIAFALLLLFLVILKKHWEEYDAKGLLLLIILASFSSSPNVENLGQLLRISIYVLLTLSFYMILDSMYKQYEFHVAALNSKKKTEKSHYPPLLILYFVFFSLVSIPFYIYTIKSLSQTNNYEYVIIASVVITAAAAFLFIKFEKK